MSKGQRITISFVIEEGRGNLISESLLKYTITNALREDRQGYLNDAFLYRGDSLTIISAERVEQKGYGKPWEKPS